MIFLVIANVVNAPAKFKKSEVKQILEKLDRCYNTTNDPRSDEYQKRRLEQFQTLADYETKHLVNPLLIDLHHRHPLLPLFRSSPETINGIK